MKRIITPLLYACILSGCNTVSGQNYSHQQNYVSCIKHSINIGDNVFVSNDSVQLKDRTEYQLNNGLVYIREYYPTRMLKSESYWINDTIPVYQIKQYNRDGKISKIVSKSFGKYDLLYVLDKVKKQDELKSKSYNLSLIIDKEADKSINWSIEYDIQNNETIRSSKLLLINSATGLCTASSTSSEDFPDISSIPIQELRPTYPGSRSDFEKTIYQGLHTINQQDRNLNIIVVYYIDTKGKLKNIEVLDAPQLIEDKIKDLFKSMPDWIPAKINAKQHYDVKSIENSCYGYVFRIILRKIK